jgi:hypothetical protein
MSGGRARNRAWDPLGAVHGRPASTPAQSGGGEYIPIRVVVTVHAYS